MNHEDAIAPEEEEEEIFEINDFTVVTEYERFAVQLESIIHDWGIGGGARRRVAISGDAHKKLKTLRKPVNFKDTEFLLIFYYVDEDANPPPPTDANETEEDDEKTLSYLPTAAKDMLSPEFDLRSQDTVFTQYGVLEHLLLEPCDSATVQGEDFYRDILSVLTMAAVNAECEIPVFVRVGELSRNLFNGVCVNRNAQTNFEAFHVSEYLKKLGYFSGLVDMFKEKVACEATDQPPVDVLVQFDYVYKNQSPEADNQSADEDVSTPSFELEFGDTGNAIKKICLSVLWPRLNDETINETDNFSDLDPYASPRWLVEVKFDESRKSLYNTVDELIDTKEMPSSDRKVGHYARSKAQEPEMASALSRITQANATDTANINFVNAGFSAETSQQFTANILRDLFESEFTGHDTSDFNDLQNACLSELAKCKAAPFNSLTSRLATILARCLYSEDGLSKMCTLWMEFVDRLTLRWENSDNIPGMEEDRKPDLGACLLHQKLQMLQYCIHTKRKRHDYLSKANSAGAMSASSSSSDIFFDADEEEAAAAPNRQHQEETSIVAADQPKGRKEPLDECLMDRPDVRIYVPVTQDKGPMTDDMLEAHANHLSSQSATDRVKEQLDVLLSDMQAFKAANPGARIEDFIYWHSPRDWTKSEDGTVTLSERMLMPNNFWLDTWNNARAVPVTAQPRLFNESKEAYAVLQYFKDLTVHNLIGLIQPVVFLNAAYTLVVRAKPAEPLVGVDLLELCKLVVRSTRHGFSEDYFDACKKIDPIENRIFWYQSVDDLLNKEIHAGGLDSIADKKLFHEFILNLVRRENPVRILDAPNGALAMCVRQLMNNANKFDIMADDTRMDHEEELRLPAPYRKHYLFRWLVPRPGINSRAMPQRMYACVGDRYCHISGAFTDDTTFM